VKKKKKSREKKTEKDEEEEEQPKKVKKEIRLDEEDDTIFKANLGEDAMNNLFEDDNDDFLFGKSSKKRR